MAIQDAIERFFHEVYGIDATGYNIEEVIENALCQIPPLSGVMKIEKLSDYLYMTEFSDHNYDYAEKIAERQMPIGGCSAIVKDNLIGRNYDWNYDNRVSFIVKTPAKNGRYASIGIASGPSDLTPSLVDLGYFREGYLEIPFLMLDGVNSQDLFAEINVVPSGDKGKTTGTHPGKPDLFAPLAIRYILDYASSIDEAITILEDHNVFASDNDEYHFLLKQGADVVEIEFVDNQLVVVDSFLNDKPIVTNFHLYGYDGTKQTLDLHAQGVERYAILRNAYSAIDDADDMADVMESVFFTKAYLETTSPVWYSEFNGGDLTINSDPDDYSENLAKARNEFQNRSRNGKTWQTVHSAVYDLFAKTISVKCQELYGPFNFTF